MRPKYEGLGYALDERNDVIGSRKFVQSKKYMQCSHYNRKGYMKHKCWDLHPCNICGLKNHCDKTCWNREWNKDFIAGVIKIDFGWSYGSSWQKITGVIKSLFKYKCSRVRRNTTTLGRRLEKGIKEEKGYGHL